MSAIWAFLTNPTNQATLTWVGTGLSALAAGAWAVVKFLSSRDSRPPSSTSAGGTPSPQNQGVDSEKGRKQSAHNFSSVQVFLLVLVLVGALIGSAGLLGRHVTAIGGAAIGGDVSHSTINVNGPAEGKRP
jgi:hypothetical protein